MDYHWGVLYTASEWAIRIVMLFYVPYRRDAAAARAWLLLIFFLPWLGLPLYFLFGRAYLPKQRVARQRLLNQIVARLKHETPDAPQVRAVLPDYLRPAFELTDSLSNFSFAGGNRFEFIRDYLGAIDRLVTDIDNSAKFVHLMYYIYADDEIGSKVSDALIRAAGRGVKVRVLMDAIGARSGLKHQAPAMRAAGIEVIALLPLRLFGAERLRPDLRNHRKIAVIDDESVFFGSQNIVSPNANKGMSNEEIVVRATGVIVKQMHAVLLGDRYLETTDIPDEADIPEQPRPLCLEPCFARILPSGPSYGIDTTENVMVGLMYAALTKVTLTTPYFIPSQQFVSAMCNAARRGVEVHLIVDDESNKPLVQLAQESYYDALLSAGVHIHGYHGNFLHAKLMTIDSHVGLIGSSNLDRRSFELNEEISVLIYDQQVVSELDAIEQCYIDQSDTVDPVAWPKRPAWKRLLQNVARLFDSLM
jgi:cardiolipin synthase